LGLWWLWKAVPAEAKNVASTYDTKKWVKESLPFFLLGGIAIINTN